MSERPNRFAAFLLYIDDWLSSTAIELMTGDEERGYLRLLLHAWKADDCGLPDDDRILAILSKLGDAWIGKSGSVVRAQFVARNGRLFNDRLLREREYQTHRRKARSEAGKVGAAARWHEYAMAEPMANAWQGDSKRMAEPMANASQINGNPNPNIQERSNTCSTPDGVERVSLPSTQPTRARRELSSPQRERFEAFWKAYWLRIAKKPSQQAFGKAVTTQEQFDRVMAAVARQREEMLSREPRHRPHAATWLNGARWDDEVQVQAKPISAAPVVSIGRRIV